MKTYTLVFLLREHEICLAMKKRGFGEGNWNGYGGKVEEGETVEEGAIREVMEEAGAGVQHGDLEKVAMNEFFFEDGKHLLVHVYFVRAWTGEPVETEEMRPRWYAFDAIPYDLMWADDIHWLPRVLQGEKIKGHAYFNADGKTIKNAVWNAVKSFD